MSNIRGWKPREIKGNPLVSITIASYLVEDPRRWDSLMCLLYSLKAQTYPNWEALIIHDGPLEGNHGRIDAIETMGHVRQIRFIETGQRMAKFGHPWRSFGFSRTRGDYICSTNDDNYVCPSYIEWLLSELVNQQADFAYCDCVHSHKQWQPMTTELKRGKIDLGCWMASADLVKKTKWIDFNFAGDWSYIHKLKHEAKKIVKVPATLFVHN